MFDKVLKKHPKEDEGLAGIPNEDADPVPPYPTEDGEASTSTTNPFPPQPYHDQAPTRVLKVKYTDWKLSKMRVWDETDPAQTSLYTTDMNMLNTRITFHKGEPSSTILAEVKPHYWTNKIDVVMNSVPIVLNMKMMKWKPDVIYESPSLKGQQLKWKVKSYRKSIDLECRDDADLPVAHLYTTKWDAKLDFFGTTITNSETALDEVTVVALALGQFYVTTLLMAVVAGSA